MNEMLAVFFAVLLLMVTCARAEEAEPTVHKSGDWEYVLLTDGTAEIAGYNGEAAKLTVPAEIDGIAVTSLGERAFEDCSSLKSITLPDSITAIGANPFRYCYKLTDIIVSPAHPTLATINGVLFEKTEKRLVCYPCAFTADSYTVPQGIRIIGDSAFYSCVSLTSITLPDSITVIGANPFRSCDQLTNIIVSPDHPTLATINGVLFEKTEKRLVCYPCAFTANSYTVPQGIRIIGDGAFASCDSLKSITLPASLTIIGDAAFFYCLSLTSITLPDSLTTIGNDAFSGCDSLTSITLPDSITAIGAYAFYSCSSLKSITLPDSITAIGDEAFSYCDSLTSITLPDSITAIGDGAFYSCSSLKSITLPESITTIRNYTFCGCDSLTSVTLPASLTSIGDYAFSGCPRTLTLTIPCDSWLVQWCEDNGMRYTYPDSLDWLLE